MCPPRESTGLPVAQNFFAEALLCTFPTSVPRWVFAHPVLFKHRSAESIVDKWACATSRMRISSRGEEGNEGRRHTQQSHLHRFAPQELVSKG